MAYKIITPATTEPITLEEARSHLRIEPFGDPLEHPDDAQISKMITSAREFCEQYTGRSFAVQEIEIAYDDFPTNEIVLDLTPVTTISSIKYFDGNNTQQTVLASNYALDDYTEPNFAVLANGESWPATSGGANNVKIRCNVGANTPAPIQSAILLLVGSFYENRQQDQISGSKLTFNSLPTGVYSLLQPYRLNIGV